jgi:hypothetical protein
MTTSRQLGQIFENKVIEYLTILSNGQLQCYMGFSDEEGIDLIVKIKGQFDAIFLQIKGRTKLEKYNQFSQTIYESTSYQDEKFYYLFCYLNISEYENPLFWFIPSIELMKVLTPHKPKSHRSQYSFSTSLKSGQWDKFKCTKHELTNRIIKKLTNEN